MTILALIVLAAVIGVNQWWRYATTYRPPKSKPVPAVVREGPARAKVVILVSYNDKYPLSQGAAKVMPMVKELIAAYPGKVRLMSVDPARRETESLRSRAGIQYYGMAVDGHYRYPLREDGKTREVRFQGPVGVAWTPKEFALAVHQAVEKHYGPTPQPRVKEPKLTYTPENLAALRARLDEADWAGGNAF
jgi:hypothetical protein